MMYRFVSNICVNLAGGFIEDSCASIMPVLIYVSQAVTTPKPVLFMVNNEWRVPVEQCTDTDVTA